MDAHQASHASRTNQRLKCVIGEGTPLVALVFGALSRGLSSFLLIPSFLDLLLTLVAEFLCYLSWRC